MRRRLPALLVAVAIVVTACGDGAHQAAPTTAASEATTITDPDAEAAADTTVVTDPTDDGVTRILFAGDSLMQEIHATAAAALGDSTETRFLLSPRLIRNDAQELIWQTTLDDFNPDVVVVMLSHWERLVVGAQRPEDIDDVDAYARQLAVPFAEFVADSGVVLVLLSAPPLRDPRATSVYAVLNQAYRSATDAVPAARFVEIGPALTGGSGAYTDALVNRAGAVERVRNTDGIHLCPGGAVLVTEAVLGPLAAVADTTPTADWQNGSWRTEAPFDKPGECPAL